jgi:type II secretory pathway pseudopilin PulG
MKIDNTKRLANAVNFRKQRGASLLEGIAYLGIAALVVLGAVSLLTSATASAKANQTTEELVALRTAVKKLHAGQTYPIQSLLKQVTAARAVPATLQVAGAGTDTASITNSWGGAVTITGTAATTFTITYNNVPTDVCVSALSGMTGWTGVRQGTTGVQKIVFPLTSVDATDVCSGANNSNVIALESN